MEKTDLVRLWRVGVRNACADLAVKDRQAIYLSAIRDVMPVLIAYGVPLSELPPLPSPSGDTSGVA